MAFIEMDFASGGSSGTLQVLDFGKDALAGSVWHTTTIPSTTDCIVCVSTSNSTAQYVNYFVVKNGAIVETKGDTYTASGTTYSYGLADVSASTIRVKQYMSSNSAHFSWYILAIA